MTEINFKLLEDLIEQAFKGAFKKETNHKKIEEKTPVYESVEDYATKTGKRFRMLKEQKERGLTRDQAFNETYGGLN